MKLTAIPLFVFLILFSISQAKAKAEQLDTLRDEFNLKKKSTAYLISGKSADTMLTFYKFYLQEKDLIRADSLIFDILKLTNDVEYRYKISLIHCLHLS
jgi:hypothetical protein